MVQSRRDGGSKSFWCKGSRSTRVAPGAGPKPERTGELTHFDGQLRDAFRWLSKADPLALVLFVEPLLKRGEVFEQGPGVHPALAGQGFEGVRPGPTLSHLQHLPEPLAGGLAAVDRASVERARGAGGAAERAVELELQHVGEKIARIGHVRRHARLGAAVEVGFASRDGRGDALALPAELPPRLVVVRGLDLTREHLPAPLVDEQ